MKKLAIVGAGGRCYSGFARALVNKYSDKYQIVGVCDKNIKRAVGLCEILGISALTYTDFDLMIEETKPDEVLVTTVDGYHHQYIIRAMELGCDVFSEKPLTTTVEKCRMIREAERRTGKRVTVTFNCRFMPYFARLKELMASGVIGRPLAINYDYRLNTVHGGDYFKRWHRFLDNSGGMMVHKATHHFDIINWILDDEPVSVSAQGARLYFGNDDRHHGERCTTCPYQASCESYEEMHGEFADRMYFGAEDVDGYVRDHCSFKSDTDIYDSMSVSVAYKKGTLLTYSLNLFSTNEGYDLDIIGEKGRIETSTFFGGDNYKIIVRYRDGRVDEITFPKATGLHAGGDDRMRDMLFGGVTEDPLGQCSDSFDGIKSCMIGIAANKSIKDGGRVDLTPILDELR